MACQTEARPRLLLDGNEGFLRALSSVPPVPLELSQEDFSRTLAHMVPQLHRPLRPLRLQHLQLSWLPPLSEEANAAMAGEYQQWCSRRPGGSSCLSLVRHEGLYLDEEDRLLMALDTAVQSVWLGVDPVVQQYLDPVAFKTATLVSLSTFLGLLLLPEPISKGIALSMGVVMLAYLGADTAWEVRDAWMQMRAEALSARSFAELRLAGERFGRVIGAQATRLLILLATGALGSTTNLFFRGPGLPAVARVSLAFQARTGLPLARVATAAQALRLERADFVVTLTPPALFMSSQGTKEARGQSAASAAAQDSRPAPGKYRLQSVEDWRKPRLTPDGKILPYPGTRNPPEPIPNLGRSRAGMTIKDGEHAIRFDKDGFVEFETPFETIIDKTHIGSRQPDLHFKAANQKLFDAIKQDPALGQQLGLSRAAIERLPSTHRPPVGHTWHHHQDVGRLQLVNLRAHSLAQWHTGGMAIWGGGYPK